MFTVTSSKPPEHIVLPSPRPIDAAPVKWKVLTKDNLPKQDGWVYYGLTPEQYEVLSRNMADVLRWIKEAEWRLKYYEGKSTLDGQNTKEHQK